jgi:outer membrane protein assembly factor BamB
VPTSHGDLYAVSTNGEVEWRVTRRGLFASLFGNPDPVTVGMPAVDTQGVYLVAETQDQTAVLVAYDHGGSKRWQYDLASRYGGHRPNGPAVADGTVYATAGGTVHAVDADSGTRAWRFVSGADVAGPPSTDGTRVYVAAKNLYALSVADGTEQWRVVNETIPHDREADTAPYVGRPPVADGQVYLRAGAFDAADGTRRWGDDADEWLEASDAYYLDPYNSRAMAQPVITDDALYLSHTHHGVRKFA